jgi:hypothetical protein
MKSSTQTPSTTNEAATEKKPGFFGRLFQKLDSSMKQKAEEKAQEGCCGGDDKSKGGKCC